MSWTHPQDLIVADSAIYVQSDFGIHDEARAEPGDILVVYEVCDDGEYIVAKLSDSKCVKYGEGLDSEKKFKCGRGALAPITEKNSRVHTTVGIYNTDTYWKTNGVLSFRLKDHIEYNLKLRGGRALVVDGAVVFDGYLNQERLDHLLVERIEQGKPLGEFRHHRDTAPYQ